MRAHAETFTAHTVASIGTVDHEALTRQRNGERFQSLQDSGTRPEVCVETLDAMVKGHGLAVAERRRTRKEIEMEYQADRVKLEERLRFAQRLGDTQEQAKTLLRAVHHLEHTNQKQLKVTLKNLDAARGPKATQKDEKKLEAQRAELARL
jgi:hypothetical protein